MRSPRSLLLALLAPACMAAAAPSGSRDTLPTTALLSFKAIPSGEDGLRSLLDRIFIEAFKSEHWKLIERQRVDAVLAERALQDASDCSAACASQIGSLLGARTLLVPEFDRVDGISSITLREIDVVSGEVLGIAEVETAESIGSSSRRIARLLIGRLLRDPDVPLSDSGYISVSSNPSSEIWIDGVSKGISPMVVPVWPGKHRVAVLPDQTLEPPKTKPVAPDVSAAPIVIVEERSHSHHHHAPPRRWNAKDTEDDRKAPPSGSSSENKNGAIVAGAAVAVVGAALLVGAATMPDSVWSDTWKDVHVGPADTARAEFRKIESGSKGFLGVLGVAALAIGALIIAVAMQR